VKSPQNPLAPDAPAKKRSVENYYADRKLMSLNDAGISQMI
jgi:hypothetical protein